MAATCKQQPITAGPYQGLDLQSSQHVIITSVPTVELDIGPAIDPPSEILKPTEPSRAKEWQVSIMEQDNNISARATYDEVFSMAISRVLRSKRAAHPDPKSRPRLTSRSIHETEPDTSFDEILAYSKKAEDLIPDYAELIQTQKLKELKKKTEPQQSRPVTAPVGKSVSRTTRKSFRTASARSTGDALFTPAPPGSKGKGEGVEGGAASLGGSAPEGSTAVASSSTAGSEGGAAVGSSGTGGGAEGGAADPAGSTGGNTEPGSELAAQVQAERWTTSGFGTVLRRRPSAARSIRIRLPLATDEHSEGSEEEESEEETEEEEEEQEKTADTQLEGPEGGGLAEPKECESPNAAMGYLKSLDHPQHIGELYAPLCTVSLPVDVSLIKVFASRLPCASPPQRPHTTEGGRVLWAEDDGARWPSSPHRRQALDTHGDMQHGWERMARSGTVSAKFWRPPVSHQDSFKRHVEEAIRARSRAVSHQDSFKRHVEEAIRAHSRAVSHQDSLKRHVEEAIRARNRAVTAPARRSLTACRSTRFHSRHLTAMKSIVEPTDTDEPLSPQRSTLYGAHYESPSLASSPTAPFLASSPPAHWSSVSLPATQNVSRPSRSMVTTPEPTSPGGNRSINLRRLQSLRTTLSSSAIALSAQQSLIPSSAAAAATDSHRPHTSHGVQARHSSVLSGKGVRPAHAHEHEHASFTAIPQHTVTKVHPLTDLPAPGDITTGYFFPNHPTKKFTAGKPVDVVLGIRNDASEAYNVTSILGSLNSPMDFRMHIQNFTQQVYLQTIAPGQDLSFEYTFLPDYRLEARDFTVALTVVYSNSKQQFFSTTFFNNTVELIEQKQMVDHEMVSLVLLLAAMALGAGGKQQFFSTTFFNSTVELVEQKQMVEHEMVSLVLLLAAMALGAAYLAYSVAVPHLQSMGLLKKTKKNKVETSSAGPDSTDEWIKGTDYDSLKKKKAIQKTQK
eukprot:gene28292-31402_t